MNYQFRILSQESKKFLLEIEVSENHSFFDLHQAIQIALGFNSYQLASFVVESFPDRKKIEVSQLAVGQHDNFCYCMHQTTIGQLVTSKKTHIQYTFDYFNDRSFNIELTGIKMEKNLKEPLVRLDNRDSLVQVLDEIYTDQYLTPKTALIDSNYGILDDYYEIFGEMESMVM